jgi:hypothetical protein
MINSRHILKLSLELIIKPQALDKTSCYKCNCTKREHGRAGMGRFPFFLKNILKIFKKVLKELKSKKSLKS